MHAEFYAPTPDLCYCHFVIRDGSLDSRRVDVEVPIPTPKNSGMEGFDVNIIAPAAQDLMKRVSSLTKQGTEKKVKPYSCTVSFFDEWPQYSLCWK